MAKVQYGVDAPPCPLGKLAFCCWRYGVDRCHSQKVWRLYVSTDSSKRDIHTWIHKYEFKWTVWKESWQMFLMEMYFYCERKGIGFAFKYRQSQPFWWDLCYCRNKQFHIVSLQRNTSTIIIATICVNITSDLRKKKTNSTFHPKTQCTTSTSWHFMTSSLVGLSLF